jgi:hypothetical protein
MGYNASFRYLRRGGIETVPNAFAGAKTREPAPASRRRI